MESVLTELAFSRKGLHVLGVKENIQDARFDKGQMVSDRKDLGDQGKWEDAFADTKDPIHGVFKIATSCNGFNTPFSLSDPSFSLHGCHQGCRDQIQELDHHQAS